MISANSKILLSLNSIPKTFEFTKATKLVELSQNIQN